MAHNKELAPRAQEHPNAVGPVAVANVNEDLAAARNEEDARDRAVAAHRSPRRFEARRMTAIHRPPTDAAIETAIYSTAANFPLTRTIFPTISTFYPCFATIMYYLNHMDSLMASTKRWIDSCMGWAPPHSQIYVSIFSTSKLCEQWTLLVL